jgi:hypothetical protein
MLGLELPLQQQQQKSPTKAQNPHQLLHPHHRSQSQQSVKYPFAPKPKISVLTLSDEDKPGFAADDSNFRDVREKCHRGRE